MTLSESCLLAAIFYLINDGTVSSCSQLRPRAGVFVILMIGPPSKMGIEKLSTFSPEHFFCPWPQAARPELENSSSPVSHWKYCYSTVAKLPQREKKIGNSHILPSCKIAQPGSRFGRNWSCCYHHASYDFIRSLGVAIFICSTALAFKHSLASISQPVRRIFLLILAKKF